MNKKVLGLIMVSMGTGMLIVIFLPWWGFVAASILVIAGGFLIFDKWC